MPPSSSVFNSANNAWGYAIFSGNFLLLTRIFADRKDLMFFQFCRSASFSAIGSAVFNPIFLVVGCRIPSKIIYMVIQWISVIVAAFFTCFRVATKSAENYSSYASKLVFIFFPQKNGWPAIFFVNSRFFDFPGFYCSYSSKIRNFIQSCKSGNRHPNFFIHNKFPVTLDMGIVT